MIEKHLLYPERVRRVPPHFSWVDGAARAPPSALPPAKIPPRLSPVETTAPSSAQLSALLRLLDDPSPSVRRALLARFAALGPETAPFLRELSHGPDRALAAHAAWFLNELKFSDPVAEFRTFINSLHYELETGALLLARTVNPALDVGRCCEQLDAIAARCTELIAEPASSREKCRIINRVMFHEWGFRGNVEHYTDPQNSFLNSVLTRRIGLPISLSLVYLLVAERLGLALEPVGLPGHFLVGCFDDEIPFYVDPFDRGLFRDPEEVIAFLIAQGTSPQPADLMPTAIHEVLCRCCRNLVHHYTVSGEPARARLFASFITDFETTHTRESE